MFDSLSDRFDGIFKRLRGKGRLSDSDVDEVLREIRVALLEADVNLSVVRTRRRADPRAVPRRRPREEPHAGAAGHQDRQRGARHRARRRDAPHHLRVEAADRRAHGRPSGLGQDHHLGQARPLVQGAGSQPDPRRSRPAAPGRRRAAPHARPPDRRAGLLRADRPGRRRRAAASPRPAGSGATS